MINHIVFPNLYFPITIFGSEEILSVLDFALVGTLAISTVVGFFRGFVSEILSLLVWVMAFWATFSFDNNLGVYFISSIESEVSRIWLSRLLILVMVLLIGGIANKLLSKIVSWKFSGNLFFGTLFGFFRGLVLVTIIILILEDTRFYGEPWVQDAMLLEYAENTSDFFYNLFLEQYNQI
jgi:membrane protein required for colicin V production